MTTNLADTCFIEHDGYCWRIIHRGSPIASSFDEKCAERVSAALWFCDGVGIAELNGDDIGMGQFLYSDYGRVAEERDNLGYEIDGFRRRLALSEAIRKLERVFMRPFKSQRRLSLRVKLDRPKTMRDLLREKTNYKSFGGEIDGRKVKRDCGACGQAKYTNQFITGAEICRACQKLGRV